MLNIPMCYPKYLILQSFRAVRSSSSIQPKLSPFGMTLARAMLLFLARQLFLHPRRIGSVISFIAPHDLNLDATSNIGEWSRLETKETPHRKRDAFFVCWLAQGSRATGRLLAVVANDRIAVLSAGKGVGIRA